jgi:hypothetical protein
MGIRVIVHDFVRDVLVILKSPKGNIIDSHGVDESVAAFQEVIFAKNTGWHKVEMEGDALHIV